MILYPREHILSLPNLLTYLRIAFIPLIIVLLSMPPTAATSNGAFIIYALASITDLLDGILARRRNQITPLGKLLDPLADKLLVSAVLIMLVAQDKVPAWMVFVFISRDFVIMGLRTVAASQGIIIDASRLGKNKMISLTVAILFLLVYNGDSRINYHFIGMVFLWVAMVLAIWSATIYGIEFYKTMCSLESEERNTRGQG